MSSGVDSGRGERTRAADANHRRVVVYAYIRMHIYIYIYIGLRRHQGRSVFALKVNVDEKINNRITTMYMRTTCTHVITLRYVDDTLVFRSAPARSDLRSSNTSYSIIKHFSWFSRVLFRLRRHTRMRIIIYLFLQRCTLVIAKHLTIFRVLIIHNSYTSGGNHARFFYVVTAKTFVIR